MHASWLFLLSLLLALPITSPLALLSPLPTRTRPDFPILQNPPEADPPLVYLDSSATSQKPLAVLNSLTDYYSFHNANVHRGAHRLSRDATEMYESARDKLSAFINSPSRSSVVFTKGATESINLITNTWGRQNLGPGDEVVLSVMEHHSNIVPWQLLKQYHSQDIVIKFCPLNENNDDLDYEALAGMITERTKVVSLVHTSNVLGVTTDASRIYKIVRSQAAPEAVYIMDGCQSLPHKKIDVQALNCDFFVASAHKMCGPTGVGMLYGKEALLNSMPPFLGGGEMIDEVTTEGSTFAALPGKFEAGTPNIAQAIGWGAAIDYIEQVGGVEGVEEYCKELGDYLYEQLESVSGVVIYGPGKGKPRAPLVAFSHPGAHVSDVSTFLDLEGVAIRAGHHCTQPLHTYLKISHTARASCYFYNTKADVDVFVDKLKETLALLGAI